MCRKPTRLWLKKVISSATTDSAGGEYVFPFNIRLPDTVISSFSQSANLNRPCQCFPAWPPGATGSAPSPAPLHPLYARRRFGHALYPRGGTGLVEYDGSAAAHWFAATVGAASAPLWPVGGCQAIRAITTGHSSATTSGAGGEYVLTVYH